MLKRTYEGEVCSLARALEVVGERWTLLIVRDALLGVRRFDEFGDSLGIARNVLSARLHTLVEHGVLERVRYSERPERHEYRLTPRGTDLATAVIALMQWGDRHLAPQGPPRLTEHARCGGPVDVGFVCPACGTGVGPGELAPRPNPAYPAEVPARPAP
ncbi:MAG TPA: helix-turn-helix domain-containing protein [Mycobacteriales bacterium]|nr:helix-turn-helix domain-containing protein [Mycobacteriales bacterium]